jgi:pimeloyl-ACP methyl ester carboxylesterase
LQAPLPASQKLEITPNSSVSSTSTSYRDFQSDGAYVRRFAGAAAEYTDAFLHLPGFPGEETERNEDLAFFLSDHFKIPAYVVHYRGLGAHRGDFAFKQSLVDATAAYENLLSLGHTVYLIGHSWGGYAALALTQKLLQNSRPLPARFALMCPYAQLPTGDRLKATLSSLFAEAPRFGSVSQESVAAEVDAIRSSHDTVKVAQTYAARLPMLICQGTRDQTVPAPLTTAFAQSVPAARYELWDDNHLFTVDRPRLFQLMREFFS